MTEKKKLEKKAHKDHKDLAGEHKFGDSGQMILLVTFLVVWILDSFVLNYTNFIAGYISIYIRTAVAVVVLILGGYIAMAGHNILFKEIREKPGVIRNGIFNKVRHPLYLGSIMFFLGLLLFSCSLVSLGVFVIIVIFYHHIARYEEKLLLEKFGDDYARYIDEVPMWLPWTK